MILRLLNSLINYLCEYLFILQPIHHQHLTYQLVSMYFLLVVTYPTLELVGTSTI